MNPNLTALVTNGTITQREPGPSHPYVPGYLLVALLEPLIRDHGVGAVGRMAGIGNRVLYDIRMGRTINVRFDTADRIICNGLSEPDLWWTVPELRAIYEAQTGGTR